MKVFKKKIKMQKRKQKEKKKMSFTNVKKIIMNRLIKVQPKNLNNAILIAKKVAKKMQTKIKSATPKRIIPIPKTGGFLPLIPIFAALSALGALSGGAAAIAKAVNQAKEAKNQLSESERHNKTMEAIAMGKGLYLKPYKRGLGLYLHESEAYRRR